MGVRYAGGHQEYRRPEEMMGKFARWLVQMGSRSGRVQIGASWHLLVEGWADKSSPEDEQNPV